MHTKRNFGLDLARALAIVMVLLAHGVGGLGALGVGVDLFFVLSGFLIGRIYLRSQMDAHERPGTFSLWGFWSARWFRTLPPYLAALAVFALADLRFHNNGVHPYYLAFLQNYVGIDGFGPSWSLCVEEHFYLALPLVGGLLLRVLPRRSLLWTLPALALVPECLRVADFALHTLPVNWFWRSHLHCEGMIFGVWLAFVFVDRRDLWDRLRPAAAVASVLPVLLLAYQFTHPQQPDVFTSSSFLLYAVGYTGVVRMLYDLRGLPFGAASAWLEAPIRGLALCSYSLYLMHVLALTDARVLIEAMPRGGLKTGITLAAALALSVLFYFAVERPTIQWRDRLLRPRKTVPAAAVQLSA